jgi:hypothetical protein
MSFAVRPTLDLCQIAASGAGFRLDAATRPTLDLCQIAAAAAQGGGTVIFAGLDNRPTLDLTQIGAAGKGHVTLEG